MKIGRVLFVVFIFSFPTFGSQFLMAQSALNSLVKGSDRSASAIDSTQSRIQNKVNNVANFPDKVAQFADSIKPDLSRYNSKLDSVKRRLTHRIDSLQRLGLPTGQYTHLLDSVERAGPLKDVRQAEARLASLERKVNEPLTKLNAGINKIVSKINQKFGQINREG